MATVIKEFVVEAPAAKVWESLRDFKAVHEKLVPGFVTRLRMEGPDRVMSSTSGTDDRASSGSRMSCPMKRQR